MTKEEREKAIDLLDNLLGMVADNQDNDYDKALKMGIESLRREPSTDAVSRATVLTLINDVKKADGFNDYSQYEYLFDNVDKMPMSVPTQRWIPCSERLPETDGDYLLFGKVCEDEEEYQFIGSYDSGCEQFGIWEEQFDRTTLGCLGSEFFEYSSVVAWMPLPKPYKQDEPLLSYADQDTMQPAT